MNLTLIDWLIVVATMLVLLGGVFIAKRAMQSVSDFLAAGRTAGRYVISLSQGMAMLGSITIVGMLEMNFIAGFTLRWWELANILVLTFITVSGWVIYRFRKTRALTMAQFFEMRYSKKFRIFTGILAFVSGILNFGIFPAVSARFFIYFCGLPLYVNVLGIDISMFALVMGVLLIISLYFVFSGGQIAVIVTDFIQGILVNTVFIAIVLYFIFMFDWETIYQAVKTAPDNASLINPFKATEIQDFNLWYFFIGTIGLIYGKLSWQGTQAYNASAKSAHEAKMGEVLGNWRNIPQWSLFLVFVPVIAYTVMHHPDYVPIVNNIQPILDSLGSDVLKTQLTVPMVLTQILPVGFMGAFVAIMVGAFIATHDTYLHSWGSIFIQDIVMPFKKKPFEEKEHLNILKYSILGVAIFIFCFSLFIDPGQYIFLFFAVTAAIFTGGSGAVIIGGLYWKRGTTAAAWSAMITGSTIAAGGMILNQIYPKFPINGQEFWGLAMLTSSIVYVMVSLLGKKEIADFDKLFHRGKYEIKDETIVINEDISKGWRIFGIGKEFTKSDKFIYITTYIWMILWVLIFIIGTVMNLTTSIDDKSWLSYWKFYIWINIIVSIIVLFWFSIGGIKDLREMLKKLRIMNRDKNDDGFING